MLKLLNPSPDKREPFLRMARDWQEHGNDRYRLALQDFDAYLAQLRRSSDPAQVPVGWVPGTEFWVEDDGVEDDGVEDDGGEIVACVRLRFWLTPSLELEGGHLGYDVRPSARGRGFGTAALGLALPEARRRGLERVLLTVDCDNLASIKVIEHNGGVLSGEGVSQKTGKPIKRYWIDTAP
jgi:predicted acetyltransferase